MKGILLFDIDKTIFDRDSFLGDFYKLFESKTVVENIYEENKKEFGHFKYKEFSSTLVMKYPNIKEEIASFFETENIEKYVFEDSKVLFQIENYRIGIWSKGDRDFQRQKITLFKNILDDDLIYIFQNKIEELPAIFEGNNSEKFIFIDDNLHALESVKDVDVNAVTVFMDREKKTHGENKKIDFRLESLSDIIQVLN